MFLHKFYKKKEDNEQQQKYTKVDLNSLPVDPFERLSIDFYHVNQRDEIRRVYLQKGPFQPLNHKFPPRDFGGKHRRFIQSWFDDNKYWLEYSIKEDATFCLYCYLFKSSIPNQGGSDHFVKSGFKAWNMKSGIDKHKEGTPHTIDVQKCQSLMNQRQPKTIHHKQTSLQEKEYQTRMNASIEGVRFLLRQGLAFRGHNEKEDSDNKADRCDVVERVVLKNAPKNAQMKCGEIQKDIVQACLHEILEMTFFAILVDESRDVKGEIVERFVGLRNVNDTSTLSLKATIYDMLSKWNLSPTRIRGRGYDRASNMSGAFNGLKTLIMNEIKSARFVHCFAHQLQLDLVFVAKNHITVNDFFDMVSRLLNIYGSSYKRRDKLRKKQADKVMATLAEVLYVNCSTNSIFMWYISSELESGTGLNQELNIKRPSDTRWGSHFAFLLNIQTIYASICDVLEDLCKFDTDRDRKAEAIRILKLLKSFDFVFCLHLMVDILGVTNHLNTILQRKDQDIVNAMNQLKSWIWKMHIIMDIVVEEVHRFNNLHHYQVDVFKEVIDMQLQELNHRFNEVDTNLLLCIACLCPILEVELGNYIKDVQEDERFNDLKNIEDLDKKMVEEKKHIIFPKIYLLVRLALILPVATPSVERTFSAMKLIKTDIRNKTSDQFFSDSLVSYVEKNILKCISNNPIVKMFQDIRPRRVRL
uniref:TTF-type domain-containing protein n=1 Tax=Lactuca sativa TaxID=4236 RepID=A0A9R1V174_LACSA|nr:hypothetical protein LSAT_V11C700376230 [Lactuca sativa]